MDKYIEKFREKYPIESRRLIGRKEFEQFLLQCLEEQRKEILAKLEQGRSRIFTADIRGSAVSRGWSNGIKFAQEVIQQLEKGER